MKIEDIMELVQAEKSKPYSSTYRVTALSTCTSLQLTNTVALNEGKKRHELIQAKYKDKYFMEVEIAVNIEGILITGHVDMLDPENLMVYEIKSTHIFPSYFRQLAMYVSMLRRLTGDQWWGSFVLYKQTGSDLNLVFEKVIYLDTTILDQVVQNIRQGRLKIAGEYCDICAHLDRCDRPYRWKGKDAVVVDEIKLDRGWF